MIKSALAEGKFWLKCTEQFGGEKRDDMENTQDAVTIKQARNDVPQKSLSPYTPGHLRLPVQGEGRLGREDS